jgi:hypothetical protein
MCNLACSDLVVATSGAQGTPAPTKTTSLAQVPAREAAMTLSYLVELGAEYCWESEVGLGQEQRRVHARRAG